MSPSQERWPGIHNRVLSATVQNASASDNENRLCFMRSKRQ